jgi:hypothetical protein
LLFLLRKAEGVLRKAEGVLRKAEGVLRKAEGVLRSHLCLLCSPAFVLSPRLRRAKQGIFRRSLNKKQKTKQGVFATLASPDCFARSEARQASRRLAQQKQKHGGKCNPWHLCLLLRKGYARLLLFFCYARTASGELLFFCVAKKQSKAFLLLI